MTGLIPPDSFGPAPSSSGLVFCRSLFEQLHVVAPGGNKIIKACKDAFTHSAAIKSIDNLAADLGEDRVWELMLAALHATAHINPPDKFLANKVMEIIAGLDGAAKLALKEGTNLDDAKEIATGLAKILSAVPAGSAKALDVAQRQRVFGNKHLFRHPVPGMTSSYKQADLLKDLAQVAKHTDADAVARLIKALKSNSVRVSGNRYALSVTAHLIKNGGATEVKFIGKYVGKWGTLGSAEIDLVCKEGGHWVIYEIKSTLKAIKTNPKQFLDWRTRVEKGWPSLGLGAALPEIKLTSPLPKTGSGAVPPWVSVMDVDTLIDFIYVPSIHFK